MSPKSKLVTFTIPVKAGGPLTRATVDSASRNEIQGVAVGPYLAVHECVGLKGNKQRTRWTFSHCATGLALLYPNLARALSKKDALTLARIVSDHFGARLAALTYDSMLDYKLCDEFVALETQWFEQAKPKALADLFAGFQARMALALGAREKLNNLP